jgi:propionyl-CoA carboxylase alpha chain
MITGIDLVEQQIRIARGEALAFRQEDIRINGHALELRVYAEDPLNNFLPAVGTLETYQVPEGEGIRVDDGYEQGMDIPIYYDPMIAKLVVHAADRPAAIQGMLDAIRSYRIEGLSTTLPFGTFVFEHDAFVTGNFDTNFVKKYYSPEKVREKQAANERLAALAALKYFMDKNEEVKPVTHSSTGWKRRLTGQ